MKLNQNSTQAQTSKQVWEHPWDKHLKQFDAEKHWEDRLKKPKPPTKEAIKKAKFIDKTFVWKTNARI